MYRVLHQVFQNRDALRRGSYSFASHQVADMLGAVGFHPICCCIDCCFVMITKLVVMYGISKLLVLKNALLHSLICYKVKFVSIII